MIKFSQKIDKKTYMRAIIKHYFAYGYTYIAPIIGIVLFSLSLFLLIRTGEMKESQMVFGLLSLILIARPYLYAYNIFKSVQSNNFNSDKTKIQFTDDDKLIVEFGENCSSMQLKDLYAYYIKTNLLYLYSTRNQYILIDLSKINEVELKHIIDTLKGFDIKKR